MRDLANKKKIQEFMRHFGRSARSESRVYFTGGVTAVLMGWRDATIDIDLRFDPELDEMFRAIPMLKEELHLNVELAAPSDFIPPLPGWETRSRFIESQGKVSFYHYDLYSQTLSKIERGHVQDVQDVESMLQLGLVDRQKLFELYEAIKPHLYRYPAIDTDSFSRAVQRVVD